MVSGRQSPFVPAPADVLKKAKGIVLLDRTQAGFIFAYHVGGQQSFLVMVLMKEDATRMLTDPNFDFGGEARGTAAIPCKQAIRTAVAELRPQA